MPSVPRRLVVVREYRWRLQGDIRGRARRLLRSVAPRDHGASECAMTIGVDLSVTMESGSSLTSAQGRNE